jgi:predicted HicB family RNase H-like nuclease
MSVIRYRDYQGSVDFEDGRLIIRILHLDDFITTEIDSASQAEAAFAGLVDDYLATCAELDKEPCRPFKGSFNVRVSPELHRRVAMAAAEVNETMNAWIAKALEAGVDAQKTGAHGGSAARKGKCGETDAPSIAPHSA